MIISGRYGGLLGASVSDLTVASSLASTPAEPYLSPFGTAGFGTDATSHRRVATTRFRRPPVAKQTEDTQQPQVHPIYS